MRVSSLLAAVLLFSLAGFLQSCEKDILTGQPEWLGNSIYERLQEEGNYTYTLRLIDDLGQTDVLSQTGSKTLFVADDAAYDAFFQSNDWSVRSYDQLSTAQKKILLNSAMVNNAYLVELLSNVSGNPPSEGQCMRRETAVSVFDSVVTVLPDQMPKTSYWDKHRGKTKGIVLLKDNTSQPMIHFLPSYMQLNKITDEDLSILTNGQATSASEAWVNGMKIVERDITCKNGYIQKVDGVMTSSANMAEIIRTHANMSRFSSLLDRFCAPYYDDAATKAYNRLYNNTDSVFTLRYFAETANNNDYGGSKIATSLKTDPDGKTVDAQISYDPGWNGYMYTNTAGYDLHYDAGAMLVPTNAALDRWWNADGRVLQDMYGAWENVPQKVLVKLINVNMINTFSETVPSKFDNIVDNTTKVPLGVTKENVDSCFMGCNGVVYLINKVFSPADYSSVSFPALINENTMNVIYWAIEELEFEPYLNSMDSYYSFIIPTNNAMLYYIDPCSYGTTQTILYQFYYDTDTKTVKAHRYNYDLSTGSIDTENALTDASTSQVSNRLTDLLNNLIIVGNVEDGHTYYKTKGGSTIKVENAGQEGVMKIYGGLQIELNNPLTVSTIYDMTETGNGKSYVVDQQMPLTSQKSTYAILGDDDRFSDFRGLLYNCGLLSATAGSGSKATTAIDYNINIFDAYNYTVYALSNDVIEDLQAKDYLPTLDFIPSMTKVGSKVTYSKSEELQAFLDEKFPGDQTAQNAACEILYNRVNDFMRYHIQDNSVFIGGEPATNVKYESFKLNPANKRFFSYTVNADDNGMTIEDQLGNVRNVVKSNGFYNIMGREYWVSGNRNTGTLYNASDVVVHEIDNALFYDSAQMTSWRDEINNITTSSAKGRR